MQCVAWRPDGQQLAAGHADGSITIYNVEDGEPLATSRKHAAPLLMVCWVAAVPDPLAVDSPYVSRMAELFAPLPQLPQSAVAQQLLLDNGPPQVLRGAVRHVDSLAARAHTHTP